jgi:hypothetical protein
MSLRKPHIFRKGWLKIPPRAHPFVKFIVRRMIDQEMTWSGLAEISGLSREMMTQWRNRCNPQLSSVEAVLGALGYRLAIVPKECSLAHGQCAGGVNGGVMAQGNDLYINGEKVTLYEEGNDYKHGD